MTCRLSVLFQITKHYTLLLCTALACLATTTVHAQTYKSNAYYEIVVVESLPEDMNLDMSLKEITNAKNKSRVGETKKNIYNFLNQTLSPLLNEYSAGDNKSLVDLAATLPISNLLDGLVAVNNGITDPNKVTPADFMIVIFPKIPDSENVLEKVSSISGLYSKNKASVIDTKWDDFSMIRSYQDLINKRLEKSIRYMYTRHYVELQRKSPFFVGALFNVHIDGDKTYIKTQLVGSLPTGIKEVFENANDQVHLKNAHSPKSPTKISIDRFADFPGAIVEFLHKPQQENLMSLSLKFGSLGTIDGKKWVVKNELQKIEETLIDKIFGVGLDFTTRFNVPYLTGDLKDGAAGATLAKLYSVKINIHEVQFNVNRIEIEKIRVSLDLQPIVDEERVKQSIEMMKYSPFAPAYIPGSGAPPMPTIEMEDISKQFTEEGNKALAPIREKLQNVLGKSPEQLLNDPKIQAEILDFVLNYMKAKQVKVGGAR
jgi:hypothetical protein